MTIQFECAAILFDLDGVLIDSSACIRRHWQQWAQQHGLDLHTIMQVAHGMRTIETMRIVAPHLPAEEEAKRFAAAEVGDTEGVFAIEGASRLLRPLPADAWAIVTSGNRALAIARLRHVGLPVPNILVTGDDVTQGKPAPEPYLLAAERIGATPGRCVVVEDAPAGLEAAHSAGMRIIAVATTHSHRELRQADTVVEHISALQVAPGEGDSRLTIQIKPRG